MTHGGDHVAMQLRAQGVTSLFALCGGHISPILTGCRARGIEIVDVRDEASAVFAADAVARMTGTPGVAAVTAGPGVTNALTALQNALLAQSPLILLGGASATVLRGRGSLQDIDQLSVVRPHVKAAVSVGCVRDIQPALARAFELALEGVPGPVFIELPLDLLYPEVTVREWYGIKGGEQAAGNVVRKAIGFYLTRHANAMFRDVVDEPWQGSDEGRRWWSQLSEQAYALATEHMSKANRATLTLLASRMLRRSKMPVILVGSQAVRSPEGVGELRKALEILGAPVFLSGMARGLLGRNHPLQCRHARRNALREADVVVLCGVPCDFRLDYGNHIGHKTKVIAVNLSPEDLFRNRVPSLPVWGDPSAFLVELAGRCPKGVGRSEWASTLQQREAAREAEIDAKAKKKGALVNPVKLMRAIDTCMSEDAVIVADGGDFVATAAYILSPRGPLRWLDPGVFGTLGVGGGFALGAATVYRGKEIWLIYGDGSSAYSLAEIDTFVRKGFSVIAVIGNDARWNQIARDQVHLLDDDVGVVLRRTDYHRVAEGYGGVGLLLDTNAAIDEVLSEARALAHQGKPVVINAMLDGSDFREGSLSV
ncbi:MAG: thiamine pyrophosphate-binding protein [Hahellaceae bacterium]|nr:thiamine pyrophosphate-binding protein [Hahellaceae bacterium]